MAEAIFGISLIFIAVMCALMYVIYSLEEPEEE